MQPSSAYEKFKDVIDIEDSVEAEDGDAVLSKKQQKYIQPSKFSSRALQLVLLVFIVCNTIFFFHVAYRQREYDGIDQKAPLTEFGSSIIPQAYFKCSGLIML